ncbi:MAG TPA: hypothetical protein ENH85_00445 [Candidatus Scalindua sp.]|nr:hypothetical protein [Candidatus Scalindua sp.]
MESNQPKCEKCGSPLVERKGTSKDGKPYHFWGCSAYPKCDFTWRPAKEERNGNVIEEIVGKVVEEKLAGIKDSLKIMNDNIILIANKLKK